MYVIKIDPWRHRVEFAFSGVYSEVELNRFDRAMMAAALKAKGEADHFDIVADFSESSVMPQKHAGDSERRARWCKAKGLRRSANITPSALMRLQIERVTKDPDMRCFATRAEALSWLDQ
ncbi:MAG TPA: hypothetical protein VJ859_13225 [Allosphingosinicella sp.]|nr:hypothetical protein [Allosphingosinicella sp.]